MTKRLAPAPPVSPADSKPAKVSVPCAVRSKLVSLSVRSAASLVTFSRSVPRPAVSVAVPVQLVSVRVLSPSPAVSVAASKPASVRSPRPVRVSSVLLRPKSPLLLAIIVSVLKPPSRTAVPVQSVTVKTSNAAPPVSRAASMLVEVEGARPDSAAELASVSVNPLALLETTVSVPPPPSRIASPNQPLTVNVLSPTPPVSVAPSIPARVKAGKPVCARLVAASV